MSPQSNVADPAEGAAAIVEHRHYIDRIDKTIVALLVERMRHGQAVGQLKRQLDQPTKSASRESEVLERVRIAASGLLSARSAERIFEAIIAETTAVQEHSHE